jgi:hypothetical protein
LHVKVEREFDWLLVQVRGDQLSAEPLLPRFSVIMLLNLCVDSSDFVKRGPPYRFPWIGWQSLFVFVAGTNVSVVSCIGALVFVFGFV